MVEATDVNLVSRVLDGDNRSFEVLVQRYETRLRSFVTGLVGSPDVANETAQIAFVKAYRALPKFDPSKAAFSTWLFTIARNTALNELARQKVRNVHESKIDARAIMHTDIVDPEHQVFAKEKNERVWSAIKQLKEPFRTVLVLSFFDELSHAQIAKISSISEGTVKSRIFRAKKMLKNLMKKASI